MDKDALLAREVAELNALIARQVREAERRGMMRAAEIADDPAHTLPADAMPVRAIPLDERSFRAGYDAAQRDIAQAIESAATDTCEHEWVDVRNKIIKDGEWCRKCGCIRPGNAATEEGE